MDEIRAKPTHAALCVESEAILRSVPHLCAPEPAADVSRRKQTRPLSSTKGKQRCYTAIRVEDAAASM
jgi:hypothetical protein